MIEVVDQRKVAKRNRHSGGGFVPMISCGHAAIGNPELSHADDIKDGDILYNHEKCYSQKTRTAQDETILCLMNIKETQRVANTDRKHKRQMTLKYRLATEDTRRLVLVCKTTFVIVLGMQHCYQHVVGTDNFIKP